MRYLRISIVALSLLSATTLAWAWGRSVVLRQEAKRFEFEKVKIKPGDKIVFQNHDEITHNIYSSTKGSEFNINIQRPGASTGVTFWNEGEVEVRCAIHPKMKTIISVSSEN